MSDEEPWYVREVDEDTGVADFDGMPYTYEHVKTAPEVKEELYRVETYIPYTDIPIHKNVYYVERHRFEEFINERGNIGERIVDVRPISYEWSDRELTQFGKD